MTLEELLPHRERFAQDAAPSREKRNSENNSFGAFILKDGTYHKVGKWVCHGWLSDYNIEHSLPGRSKFKSQGIAYVLSAVMKPHVTEAQALNFIDWLINRSPWAEIFVDKDASSVYKYGYVVDANYPASFITSAFIASRFITESYLTQGEMEGRCLVYHELLEIGCTENEAFMFAHMYAPFSCDKLYPVTFSRFSSGHSTFHAYSYQENYVRNFLRGEVANPTKALLSEGKGYESYTINNLWGRTTDKDSFASALMGLIPKSKVKKNDLHIFRKAPAVGYSYKDREDFTSIIEQLRGMINA